MNAQGKAIKSRFMSKVKKTDPCWLWTAYKSDAGYGSFWFKRKLELAHRSSWTLFKGKIPKGIHVLHKCDNPSCVNPRHLFLGTNLDNIMDKVKKGRSKFSHLPIPPNSKLSPNIVLEIRKQYIPGNNQGDRSAKALGRKYGIHPSYVYRLIHKRCWSAITDISATPVLAEKLAESSIPKRTANASGRDA